MAERKYGFENSTTRNSVDFCINNGFIKPVNKRDKLSYCLVAVPDISVDGEDLLTSTIVENPQLVIPGSAVSSSSLNERVRRQLSNFSNRASLINCDNGGKNSNQLLFNLDRGVNVDNDSEGNFDAKNLLSFCIQKMILLQNQNSFLLKQNNFLKHQIDQNNKIILKILSNNSQVESNVEKSDNNLQKSNKKNPLVEVVKENISKLAKDIKTPQM